MERKGTIWTRWEVQGRESLETSTGWAFRRQKGPETYNKNFRQKGRNVMYNGLNGNDITVFHLMGNINLVRKKEFPLSSIGGNPPTEEDAENNRKKAIARAKARGGELLKKTAGATPQDDYCIALMQMNRAIQTHLNYFCGIVRLACEGNTPVSYGEYRIRLKSADTSKIYRMLRNWCRKNLVGTYSAVSIGIGVSGYVYVYFVITSDIPYKEHDTSVKMAQYLRKKKFTPITFLPYEKNPLEFLKWKYQNEGVNSTDALLRGDLWAECYQIMRASYMFPYSHRTIRTQDAIDAVQRQAEHIPLDEISMDAKTQKRYSHVASAFIVGDGYEDEEDSIKDDGIDADPF